ncbi:MAG: phenylacetate--CoA ligase family protein [Candidatus Wildermuthbacteria bacterium]|nr:phenylacetate--CoA ligase family protein [Candidatus Wildermuthbacteria bacterium]
MIPGFQKALEIFRSASERVPAYGMLLKHGGINPRAVRGIKDFKTLPIIEKKTYIYRYPLNDLFPERKIPSMGYASSGSSGKPTLWFLDDIQEQQGGDLHERIFRDIFKIQKKDTTLMIVCFAMGIWIAGIYTLASCRNVARKGYALTTITPGIEQKDILRILKDLAPRFKHTIIAGYPPFLMNVFSEMKKKQIPAPKNIRVLTAGDKFSETWRKDVATLLGMRTPDESIINIYGCADAGMLGFETPLSIFLRKKSESVPGLSRDLFGTVKNLPGIFQYNPNHVFFEEHEQELLLTVSTSAPLVRYNIHDIGNVFPHKTMRTFLKTHALEKETEAHGLSQWTWPFVTVKGRTDVAVTFYALNIYPEHIKQGLEDARISRFLSGNYFAHNQTTNHSKTQTLHIDVELAPGVRPTKTISQNVRTAVSECLLRVNMEFHKLHSILGGKALPLIALKQYGETNFHNSDSKGILNIQGKKPKMSS